MKKKHNMCRQFQKWPVCYWSWSGPCRQGVPLDAWHCGGSADLQLRSQKPVFTDRLSPCVFSDFQLSCQRGLTARGGLQQIWWDSKHGHRSKPRMTVLWMSEPNDGSKVSCNLCPGGPHTLLHSCSVQMVKYPSNINTLPGPFDHLMSWESAVWIQTFFRWLEKLIVHQVSPESISRVILVTILTLSLTLILTLS